MVALESSRRVRPGLRWFAIAAFIVLVPIALHAAWDYYEARRLARIVSDIRAKNEPVASIQQIGARTDSQENAARYYEAAAALVYLGDSYGPSGLFNRMDVASDADRPRLVQEVRTLLERNREAETLLARATDLPFEGYGPGTGYSYRADRLSKLAMLANLRTLERIDARDADAAALSIVQQLRINRPLSARGVSELSIIGIAWACTPALREVGRVLAADPSDASLQRVQKAIRELDDETILERSVMSERAFVLGSYWNDSRQWFASWRDAPSGAGFYLMRPLLTRSLIQTMALQTRLLDQSRQPWPARLQVDVVDSPPGTPARGSFWLLQPSQTLGRTYRARAASVATALALGRTADAAIGVEQYRRAHAGGLPDSLAQLVPVYLPKVPIDPFSGSEIRYSKSATRYVVYSFGKNEKDDGGAKVEYPTLRSGAFQDRYAPPDLGIAIQVESRRAQ